VNYLASVDVVSREAYRIQSVVGQQILEPEDGSTIKNERFDREFFSFRYLNSLQCTAGFLAEAIAVQKNLKIIQKMNGYKPAINWLVRDIRLHLIQKNNCSSPNVINVTMQILQTGSLYLTGLRR
jgi:hypothetical protein